MQQFRRALSTVAKPTVKPKNPNFGSGPCSKRPGWSLQALSGAALGRCVERPIARAPLTPLFCKTKARTAPSLARTN